LFDMSINAAAADVPSKDGLLGATPLRERDTEESSPMLMWVLL